MSSVKARVMASLEVSRKFQEFVQNIESSKRKKENKAPIQGLSKETVHSYFPNRTLSHRDKFEEKLGNIILESSPKKPNILKERMKTEGEQPISSQLIKEMEYSYPSNTEIEAIFSKPKYVHLKLPSNLLKKNQIKRFVKGNSKQEESIKEIKPMKPEFYSRNQNFPSSNKELTEEKENIPFNKSTFTTISERKYGNCSFDTPSKGNQILNYSDLKNLSVIERNESWLFAREAKKQENREKSQSRELSLCTFTPKTNKKAIPTLIYKAAIPTANRLSYRSIYQRKERL